MLRKHIRMEEWVNAGGVHPYSPQSCLLCQCPLIGLMLKISVKFSTQLCEESFSSDFLKETFSPAASWNQLCAERLDSTDQLPGVACL